MNSEDQLSRNAAEDRASLREELLQAEQHERLRVFDALNRESDPDEEVPEMPEDLRDQLIEQFGDRTQRQVAMAPANVGLIDKVVAFFQAKPLASFGGVAAAACAVMFMVMHFGDVGEGVGTGGNKISTTRGGADGPPAKTEDVPVYLFPQTAAEEVHAKMANGRKIVVCADKADFEKRLDAKWAVAVDVEQRIVITIEDGKTAAEKAVEGEGVRGILLGIREALDEMSF